MHTDAGSSPAFILLVIGAASCQKRLEAALLRVAPIPSLGHLAAVQLLPLQFSSAPATSCPVHVPGWRGADQPLQVSQVM